LLKEKQRDMAESISSKDTEDCLRKILKKESYSLSKKLELGELLLQAI
jgi:hypothetical protein